MLTDKYCAWIIMLNFYWFGTCSQLPTYRDIQTLTVVLKLDVWIPKQLKVSLLDYSPVNVPGQNIIKCFFFLFSFIVNSSWNHGFILLMSASNHMSCKSYSAPALFSHLIFKMEILCLKRRQKKPKSSEGIKKQVTNCACYYLINILVRYSPNNQIPNQFSTWTTQWRS